jgi:hypothetical protein
MTTAADLLDLHDVDDLDEAFFESLLEDHLPLA